MGLNAHMGVSALTERIVVDVGSLPNPSNERGRSTSRDDTIRIPPACLPVALGFLEVTLELLELLTAEAPGGAGER